MKHNPKSFEMNKANQIFYTLKICIFYIGFLQPLQAQNNTISPILDTAGLYKLLNIKSEVEGKYQQRKLDLCFSMMGVTSLLFVNADTIYKKINGGNFNISIGLDYYSKNSLERFQSITLSHSFSFFDGYDNEAYTNLSYYNNIRYRKAYFGFGFNITQYRFVQNPFWYYFNYPIKEEKVYSHFAVGFNAQIYLYLGKLSDFGIQFRPTFLRLTSKENLILENSITINFVSKIRLRGQKIYY